MIVAQVVVSGMNRVTVFIVVALFASVVFGLFGHTIAGWWYRRRGRDVGTVPDPDTVVLSEAQEVNARVEEVLTAAREIRDRADIIIDRYEADGGIVDRRRQ